MNDPVEVGSKSEDLLPAGVTEEIHQLAEIGIEGASFRITTLAVEGGVTRVAVPARLYVIEQKTDSGEWIRLKRVQYVKFEVEAKGLGTLTIRQLDHDPQSE